MNAVANLVPDIQTPPHSPEAEQAVLGSMMLNPACAATVSERITDADFFAPVHQFLFRVIMRLAAKGAACDAVTILEAVEGQRDKIPFEIDPAYPVEIANGQMSSRNVSAYADIVRSKAVSRNMAAVCRDAAAAAMRGGDGDLLADTIAQLMRLQKNETNSEHTLKQAMSEAYDEISAVMRGKQRGIPTGLGKLDDVLGGWQDSDLIVIGARPAHGKTALLVNHALAASDARIGVVSAEQPASQIAARALAIHGNVNASRMRNGKLDAETDMPRLVRATETLTERRCMIYDRSGPTIADVERVARKWAEQDGLDVLFVDYVQRLRADTVSRHANRAEQIGEVVRGLKNLARDLEIPVVAAAQVGRQVDSRAEHQPHMGDLSDSSEIEKEADQVITLMRPVMYDQHADSGKAVLSVEKNRHGPVGSVDVTFSAQTMRFADQEDFDGAF